MLEDKINKLMEKRKLINNSNSFTEISKIWNEIKKEHEECKNEVTNILKDLDSLNNETNLNFDLDENFNFDNAFNRMKEITEYIKTCSASNFIKHMKEMGELKKKCLKYLSKEKANIEEVKL